MTKAENIVTGIYGNKGDGKTSFLTYLLKSEFDLKEKIPIFSNYELCFDFKWLNAYELLLNWSSFEKSTIGIDELHEYADSRNSSTLQNKLVCGFFLQSRHTESNINYTTQFPDQIDKRIRRITDIDIYIANMHKDMDGDGDDDLFQFTICDMRYRKVATKYFYAKPIFDLYNSKSRINPFMVSKEKQKELIQKIEQLNTDKYENNK